MVKGYKAFDKDLKCRGMQYEVGKTYELEEYPVLCRNGFHFCKNAVDVFAYYEFSCTNTRVCEIIAYGEIVEEGNKCATNKIEILKELSWEEILGLCNIGKCNTGYRNSGDWNTGNRNTGNRNTGNWNTGDRNTGNWNTGDWNTGKCNTGYGNTDDWNTGNCNTGNRNTGNWNTGNWNTGNCNTGNRNTGYGNSANYSNGVFCTIEPTVNFFNKPSNITLSQFYNSRFYDILSKYFILNEWIYEEDMTDSEKEEHPEYKTIGGYLKNYNYKEAWINAWNKMSIEEREIVKEMPNFDKDIFYEITGVKI